jgi:hypothetical protein
MHLTASIREGIVEAILLALQSLSGNPNPKHMRPMRRSLHCHEFVRQHSRISIH